MSKRLKQSAGLLMFREKHDGFEVFLVHPGGPYWSKKNEGTWAFAGDCDPNKLVSNTCEVEWPPRSQKRIVIPEVDRGAWFKPEDAAIFIRDEQQPFLGRLMEQFSGQ
jgi:predicted NUDIX family NTP pyrophosphohydrolase